MLRKNKDAIRAFNTIMILLQNKIGQLNVLPYNAALIVLSLLPQQCSTNIKLVETLDINT